MFKRIVNITLMLFALSLPGAVQALSGAADDFDACVLSGGADAGYETTKVIACCIRVDEFYEKCTACVKGTSTCRTTTSWNPQMSSDASPTTPTPPSLRDQVKRPAVGVGVGNVQAPPKPPTLRDQVKQPAPISAPAKAVAPSKPATVEPIKQHQKMEAPAKASQTMSQ